MTADATETRRYQWPMWSNDGRLAFFCCVALDNTPIVLETFVSQDGSQAAELVYTGEDQVFYHAFWSPATCSDGASCRDLAILLNDLDEETLAVQVVRSGETGVSDFVIGTGDPFYYNWSPDGTRMVWQRFNREFSIYDFATESNTLLDFTPGFVQAPAWSPVDDRLLLGVYNEAERLTDLVIVEGETVTTLAEGIEGLVSYSWSPDGTAVAYRVLAEGNSGPLYVLNATTGAVLASSPEVGVFAFFWSPDSSRVAYVTSAQAQSDGSSAKRAQGQQRVGLAWAVLDVSANTSRVQHIFIPTNETIYLLNFFDQFAPSHRIWSPDSTAIIFGEISPEGKAVVSILDMIDGDAVPSYVADGFVGVWSYN
ncbi:MAG: hypothetical protein SF029_22555 [bacterium]|nr:hypothetical protein [bacterium]